MLVAEIEIGCHQYGVSPVSVCSQVVRRRQQPALSFRPYPSFLSLGIALG